MVRFQPHSLTAFRTHRIDLLAIVEAALQACDPRLLLTRALVNGPPDPRRPIWLVAAGKAAGPMSHAAISELGSQIWGGIVIAPAIVDGLPAHLKSLRGNHPEPGAESAAAGGHALALARGLGVEDQLLVLLSGGASSLMAVPVERITLADKRAATAQLLRAGANIQALNTVRKHLSAVKGGRLAASTRAQCLTFAISDVVGDDLSVIGSGPTVADGSTYADAHAVLLEHGGLAAFPSAVVDVIEAGRRGEIHETPKAADLRLRDSQARVIGGRHDAMTGAGREAAARGYHVITIEEPVTGTARDVAGPHLERALSVASSVSGPVCVISTGETTVRVTGSGRGGRNQEFGLALVDPIAAMTRDVLLASVGTDGVDGPTDAAGVVVDRETARRARETGLAPPESYLANNDSYRFFAQTSDLIKTGPTGTNVGDLQVILIT